MAQRDVNPAAVNLVKSFEGLVDGNPATVNIDPYLDPIGIWTIGWGHAIAVKGRFLRGAADKAQVLSLYPTGITLDQAVALLQADLMDAGRDVAAVIKVPVNDNEFGALVSFAFNLGVGNLSKSTLLKLLNAGDRAGAAEEFVKWNKAGGVVMAGLTKRRLAERELFLTVQAS